MHCAQKKKKNIQLYIMYHTRFALDFWRAHKYAAINLSCAFCVLMVLNQVKGDDCRRARHTEETRYSTRVSALCHLPDCIVPDAVNLKSIFALVEMKFNTRTTLDTEYDGKPLLFH